MLRLPPPPADGQPAVVDPTDQVEGPGSGPPPVPAIPATESAAHGIGRLVEAIELPDPPKRSEASLKTRLGKFNPPVRPVDPVPAGSFLGSFLAPEPVEELPPLGEEEP